MAGPPIYSKDKLTFGCLWMMASNDTYRQTESDLSEMDTPWKHEPVPDHTTLVRHMQTIPYDWLDTILAETAHRCLAEVGMATAPLAADSSGVETTRYEEVERPSKKAQDFVKTAQKTYWKYHITAIVGLQMVLCAFGTPGNVQDTTMLPVMLEEIKRRGFRFKGRFF